MKLRKLRLILVTTLVLLSLQVPTVFAASPHFIDSSAAMASTGSVLNVSFTLAGLGKSTGVMVIAMSYATEEFVCLNPDGSLADTLQTSGTSGRIGFFAVDMHGRVSAILPIYPSTPPWWFCTSLFGDSNQKVVLASVSYTNIQLSEDSAGTVDVPGTYSRTFYTLP